MIKSRDDYYDQRIKRHQEGADYHAKKQEESNSQNTDYNKKKEEYHRTMIDKLSAQKARLTEQEYRKIKNKGEKVTPENYQQNLTVHADLKTHGKATPGGGMGTILPIAEVSDQTLKEFKDEDVCNNCGGLYKDHPAKHVFEKKSEIPDELTERPPFEMIYEDDDICEICGDCFQEHLDKNKFKLKKDIAPIVTTTGVGGASGVPMI